MAPNHTTAGPHVDYRTINTPAPEHTASGPQ